MKRVIDETTIPLLKDVLVRNHPMPLWYAHWIEPTNLALQIRQHVARPLKKGGLDLTLQQYENTHRGIVTIRGIVPYEKFLKFDKSGTEEWLCRLITLINLKILGGKTIENIILTRTHKPKHLAYYGSFYSDQMDLIIYTGSGEKIDHATVVHMPRSFVDETTRDWSLLLQRLPLEVWAKEV